MLSECLGHRTKLWVSGVWGASPTRLGSGVKGEKHTLCVFTGQHPVLGSTACSKAPHSSENWVVAGGGV